jgi:hypothetical protein
MSEQVNWSFWGNMATIPLDYACLLSLNITPLSEEARLCRDECHFRGAIAVNHITDGTLPFIKGPGKHDFDVRPVEFRTWGESLPVPFTFPDEFPRAQTATLVDAPADDARSMSAYPEELRAAIEAFEAVHGDEAATRSKTPKAALKEWLETNRPDIGDNARARISTVANWKPSGGAPKTPGG